MPAASVPEHGLMGILIILTACLPIAYAILTME